MTDPDDELLTPYEVTALLRVHFNSVYEWIRGGILPAHKVGRRWRIRRSELNAWLEERRVRSAA